jgi:RHH-type proline utilization regulon transcriptional repressor/proline dehydrogenase/delta 1-pyrroline-5-carboxylate dehydrogenase
VIASAFDSAGQRCSALRVLCLQDDIADRVLTMLQGALAELRVGNTAILANDIGPVITAQARDAIEAHVAAMRAAGCTVTRLPLPSETAHGTFVAPTVIELASPAQLDREVFGPVLHVLRYRRDQLDDLIDAINGWGYGLTFGLHTRLDAMVDHVTARVQAGNLYINRNLIGAVVGVQPFGGHGLSGTGPKAGGPLYLRRLVHDGAAVAAGESVLAGPVGERNLYRVATAGRVLVMAQERADGEAVVAAIGPDATLSPDEGPFARAVLCGDDTFVLSAQQCLAAMDGAIIPAWRCGGGNDVPALALLGETTLSINTTAAGGNASLMALEA